MPKLLCLPGFLQSGTVFAEKSSGIRKILTKKLNFELDYIDPPKQLLHKGKLPFALSPDPEQEDKIWDLIVEKNCNRCWWTKETGSDYEGFDSALSYVVDHIREHGPYDGILGFSQGAAMSAVISNYIEQLLPGHGPFKVAVLFSPFAFTCPKNADDDMGRLNTDIEDLATFSALVKLFPGYEKYFTLSSSNTKTVLIYGSEDAVVPPIRSEYLGSLCANVELVKHDGGHYVPNKKLFLNPIVESIKKAVEVQPLL